MFDTPAAAYEQLTPTFTRGQAEAIVASLEPTLVFRPRPGKPATLGGTRIGGTPDLPKGLEWPRRTPPANADEIAGRASPEAGEELRYHFRLAAPYAFFAQVDLAEARRTGAAEALPDHGRLLFFYDLMGGPYDTGTETARVIWDESPSETLTKQEPPAALRDAAQGYHAALRKAFAEAKLPPPEQSAGTPYGGPERAMTLHATLRPPSPGSFVMADNAALQALYGSNPTGENTFRDAYQEFLGRHFDTYYGAANAGHRNQCLGSPIPEQDDPRFDAEVVTRLNRQHLGSDASKELKAQITEGARSWRLLLQIDVGDYLQENGEGTVYFLIRASDLAERRFDRVVAVYQQT